MTLNVCSFKVTKILPKFPLVDSFVNTVYAVLHTSEDFSVSPGILYSA